MRSSAEVERAHGRHYPRGEAEATARKGRRQQLPRLTIPWRQQEQVQVVDDDHDQSKEGVSWCD